MTKAEIKYVLPERRCENCQSMYYNSYDDLCCRRLDYKDTVEKGGVCDLWSDPRDGNVINVLVSGGDKPRSCETCAHSYMLGTVPTCGKHTFTIVDKRDFCGDWENGV